MNSVRESVVERRLVSRMKQLGLPCYKIGSDFDRGMPDRLIPLPGERCVWVETKTQGGKLSEFQRYRHRQLRDVGQRVAVVWTVEQVDALAEEIKKSGEP